jgi:glycosyltransferase involved in cell wall biosynthesis
MIAARKLQDRFQFFGFVPIPAAFELLKDFDFGLVTWGDLPKNHLHTAMKVMDYMCCAVPVCSLRLREQIKSTGGIGVHADSFDEIAERIAALRDNPADYERLRQQSLRRFNEALAWPMQERNLLGAYRELVTP